ncbi:MAG TPA: cytochrome c biogenesis protein ResB [Streptosporangiaceae bacterium]|nr:cytochrome c biogenesis protein ResB [Streptosporangiaceae bacterium]
MKQNLVNGDPAAGLSGPEQAEPGSGGAGMTGPRLARAGGVSLGAAGWLRWGWRQLTSMRTALVLLFLLALASIPGSVLPQQGIDPAAVTQYYATHPALAPVLARLSLFDVFGAPWFAAIYLLLFTSLAGCVLPRAFRMARSVRQPPPSAPRRLGRLPHAVSFGTATGPAPALDAAAGLLAGRRFRLRTGDGWVSAEKGYLHEVGNLLFHLALLGLLGSVALGGLFGYKANRLLVVGDTYANTPTAMDVFRPGRLVSPSDPQPFSLTLEHFTATYITSGPQRDQPSSFSAALRYSEYYGGPVRSYDLRVNHPLVVDGVRVFLIGHGYAPVFKVTDGTGHVRFGPQPVPFIPVEQAGLTSAGVIKVPDASPEQLGFAGVFLPTAVDVGGRLASAFPAALFPRVSLVSYAGDLGLNGQPQSVYTLDTSHMHKLAVAPVPLAPGQSIKLPHGLGTLTFTGYRQWISLAITYDPGQLPALISAILALAGLVLSFCVRRRRMFVRAQVGAGGRTVVEVAGLTRSDAAGGFETEFAELAGEIMQGLSGSAVGSLPGDGRPGDGDLGGQAGVDGPAVDERAAGAEEGAAGAEEEAAGAQEGAAGVDGPVVVASAAAGRSGRDSPALAEPEGE